MFPRMKLHSNEMLLHPPTDWLADVLRYMRLGHRMSAAIVGRHKPLNIRFVISVRFRFPQRDDSNKQSNKREGENDGLNINAS